MALDIYKKTPIVMPSEEHILLDSLGGRLVSKALLDKSTNDLFGSSIDAAVANAVGAFRVLLDAKAADGRAAPAVRGLRGADGKKYNVLAGGKPEIAEPKFEVQKTDDGIAVSGTARSVPEAKRLLSKTLAKHGLDRDALDKHAQNVEEHAPTLTFNIEFGAEACRGILKMACNLLAHSRPDLFLGTAFDPTREAVLSGAGNVRDLVAFNTSPVDVTAGSPLGPVDHLIVVQGDANTGTVNAFVALYGHIQFALRLGTAPLESSFTTTYRVDQLAGTDRLDAPEDTIAVPVFTCQSDAEYDASLKAMESAFGKLLPFVMKRQRDHAIREIVDRSMEEALGAPDGHLISENELDDLVGRVTERFMRLLKHEGAFRERDLEENE